MTLPEHSTEVPKGRTCWVLTDGRAGNLSSALGLAEAVGLEIVEKTVVLAKPWVWLPPRFWPPGILGIDTSASSLIEPPWPDLVISCGRRSIGPALEVKRRSGGHCLAVHIQHPRMNPARFDLVAAPAHDGLNGPNVEVTAGAVHRVTREMLDNAADFWRDRLSHLPHPRVAVSIGGSNAAYRLDGDTGAVIGAQLATLVKETGVGIMLTCSRRTGTAAEKAIRTALAGTASHIWDGEGENPYYGYLGLADRVIVTGDSVNMVSEAAATGKPVQVIHLPVSGRAGKFERFHRAMEEVGATRRFSGELKDWDFTPSNDTQRVAARVRALLQDRSPA